MSKDCGDPYENLANAIILSAVRDYRSALKWLSKSPKSKMAAAEVDRLENFFYSQWYEMLTDVDGAYLVNRLREEVGL